MKNIYKLFKNYGPSLNLACALKLKMGMSNKGFSLLELMIVIVIMGVLAGAAVPIYNKNVEKAKRSEAVASIGSILNELIVYHAVEGNYPINESFQRVVGKDWNDIRSGELTGTYFKDKNFKYRSYDGIEYRIKCQKAGVLDKQVWLDETGHWKFDIDEEDLD